MAEEESFVILGSSSQLNSLNSVQETNNDSLVMKQNEAVNLVQPESGELILIGSQIGSLRAAIASAIMPSETPSTSVDVWKRSNESSTNEMIASTEMERSIGRDVWKKSVISNVANSLQNDDLNKNEKPTSSNTGTIPKTTSTDNKTEIPAKGKNINDDPLAVSFIMGQVPADALKATIHSQFPSVSLQDCEELTTVMSDYLKMKDLIIQVNDKMNTWLERKAIMHSVELENRQKIQECQEQIAALRNENSKIKQEFDAKIEQLTEQLNEKSALIENMRAQIQKLETQQLTTSEVVAQTRKEDKESDNKSANITLLEHERIVKNFERNMSQLLAEKLQVSDMQKQYIDEINCLKADLKSSEELVCQLQTDICLLKSTDAERTAQFVLYSTQRDQMSEEISILRQQVDVYSRDFKLERTAREEMAGEKAQLLDDLRALQRVNQKLTEQVANHEERLASITSTQQQQQPRMFIPKIAVMNTRPSPPPAAAHACPICSDTFSSLTSLQEHVNQCLDKNVHT